MVKLEVTIDIPNDMAVSYAHQKIDELSATFFDDTVSKVIRWYTITYEYVPNRKRGCKVYAK